MPAANEIARSEAAALPPAPTTAPPAQIQRPGPANPFPGRDDRRGFSPFGNQPPNNGRGNPATTAPTPAPANVTYKDGSYTGHGTSRRGDVDVTVTIQGGKIASAVMSHSTLQYPISRISRLPGQVVDRQSASVDNVSGATLSTQAFTMAVRQALSQAV
jgi:uncharacterized protein with FMN-binding domain